MNSNYLFVSKHITYTLKKTPITPTFFLIIIQNQNINPFQINVQINVCLLSPPAFDNNIHMNLNVFGIPIENVHSFIII